MTFAAPAFLLASAIAAAAIGALHLLVLRQPRGDALPTARFVPSGAQVVRTLARRPSDRLVLALRLAAVTLAGLAFARPMLRPPRVPVVRIVIADRSREVGDVRDVADSARHWVHAGSTSDSPSAGNASTVLVLFDSSTRVIEAGANDSLDRLVRDREASPVLAAQGPAPLRSPAGAAGRGSLSAALVAALQTAGRWRDRADSLELILVSPLAGSERDAATDAIRARWPGAIRIVRVAERSVATDSGRHPIVDWPADGHAAHTAPRRPADTVGAVIVGDIVVVAPFPRTWRLDAANARVIGRWADGEPAAIERAPLERVSPRHGPNGATPDSAGPAACERDVAIPVTSRGDITLRPEFRRLWAALHIACGADVGAQRVAGLPAGWDPSAARPTRIAAAAVPAAVEPTSPGSARLAIALLALALLALLAELLARRRSHALP